MTGAAKGVFTHSQSSCHIAEVVLALTAAKSPQRLTRYLARPPAVSLYGAFFVKEFFCLSSVSLFDLKARFFVPTRGSLTSSRAGAVKVGRRANRAACSGLAR